MAASLSGLVITKAALDSLETIPKKIRSQLIKKIKSLPGRPKPQGSARLKGLKTDDGDAIYRYRSGNYRIIYVIRTNPNEVIVLDIGDRKDIYRGMNWQSASQPQKPKQRRKRKPKTATHPSSAKGHGLEQTAAQTSAPSCLGGVGE